MSLAMIALLHFCSSTLAQFAKTPTGPDLHGASARLFGDHSAFSAMMIMSSKVDGKDISMPGRLAFDAGKSRFEMDIGSMQGGDADATKQAKEAGMDKMIAISRPDKKLSYSVWPGFKSYMETALQSTDSASDPQDFKIETTNLGKENLDGHPCDKNKVVVTDKKGVRHESTVWNATDLKQFPIQIESVQEGNTVRMLFRDVQLAKPAAELFDPPAGYTRYTSMQEMMMTEMMKREKEGGADREEAAAGKTAPKEKDGKKVRDLFKRKLLPF